MDVDPAALARTYYRSIDEGAYDELAGVLAPRFVHVRPDRTIEGREAFVRFMREDRPETETHHHVERTYLADDGARRVAVEGRLVRTSGTELFRFVDAFELEGDRLSRLRTYTD